MAALPFILLHFATPLVLIYTKYVGYGFIGLYLIACSLQCIESRGLVKNKKATENIEA